MLGKKCSLAPLKEELRKQGVSAKRGKRTSMTFDLSLFMQERVPYVQRSPSQTNTLLGLMLDSYQFQGSRHPESSA